MSTIDKACLACHKPLKGRVDKKFCDDYCRNNYNNQLNSDATPMIRKINNALRKNRRILEECKPEKERSIIISKEKLLAKGFRFEYFTNTYTTNKNETYYYCYDFGYVWKEDIKKYKVVKALPEIAEKV